MSRFIRIFAVLVLFSLPAFSDWLDRFNGGKALLVEAKYKEARDVFLKLYNEERKGDQKPEYLAATLGALAVTNQHLGNINDAVEQYKWQIALLSRLPSSTVEHSIAISNLASLIMEFGRYDEAKLLLVEASQLIEGKNTDAEAEVAYNLAIVELNLGNLLLAEVNISQALEAWEGLYTNKSLKYLKAAIVSSRIEHENGNHQMAKDSLEKSINLLKLHWPNSGHLETAQELRSEWFSN